MTTSSPSDPPGSSQRLRVADLMAESGVGFGTSGARGLVTQMTDRVCYGYVQGFLRHLLDQGRLAAGATVPSVAIGGDRRPSTPRIMQAVAQGVRDLGYRPIHLGLVPSPAVALYGMKHGIPTVMVTGSHIPADRNGMKFTTASGEIDKADELGIKASPIVLPDIFRGDGSLRQPAPLGAADEDAALAYVERYVRAFPEGCLRGMHLGVYGHSAVGRDLLCELYARLGARVTRVGFSEEFVPVDTEAIREEDEELSARAAEVHDFTALVSTDGDSDRPLTADEKGRFLRGDVSGILTARFLGADAVATPVSCNSALELSEEFPQIVRTRIGSPFVIAGMAELSERGAQRIVGYEANGGFLHSTSLQVPGGGTLAPLPTRDPVIVHLAVLLLARRTGKKVSELLGTLPQRVTASGRDQSFETARSQQLLARLRETPATERGALFGLGPVLEMNETDGLRLTFGSGEILHFRPSGNAPELRCYAEAGGQARAQELVQLGLQRARELALSPPLSP